LRLVARRLVISQRAKIAIIAAALLKSGTLTGDAVIELLNDATPSASWVHHVRGSTISRQRSIAADATTLILLPLSGTQRTWPNLPPVRGSRV
jgi:hypothetical protein